MAAAAGVDPGNPQLTEYALLGPAVTVGVLPSAHDCLLGNAEDVLAAAAVSLGECENLLVTCAGGYTTFDARHVFSP